MDFKYIFADLAINDLDQIVFYLSENVNKKYANKIQKNIETSISKICKEPKLYQIMEEQRFAIKQVRRVPIDGYLIYYKVDEEQKQINIARIRSDKQYNKNLVL